MQFDCVGIGIYPADHLALLKSYPKSNVKTQAIESEIQTGGPTATALSVLARFGRKTAVIGNVGNDGQAVFVIASLRAKGIYTKGLVPNKTHPHPVAYIWVDKSNGNRSVVLTQKLPNLKRLNRMQKQIIGRSRFVLVDGTEPDAGLQALHLAKKLAIPTMMDAGSVRETTCEMMKLADYVIGSKDFARQYRPGVQPAHVAKELTRYGAKVGGITLGPQGVVLYHGKRIIRQRALTVKAKDTTGAGDVYHGAFIEGLLRGWPIQKTTRFAAVVAGLKCCYLGGSKGIPSFQKALQTLSRLN